VQFEPAAHVSPKLSDPEGRDQHLEKLFSARNGTKYDPTSALDRRKMEKIKRGLLEREPTGAKGSRRGAEGNGSKS
jgi:hypothetical protein